MAAIMMLDLIFREKIMRSKKRENNTFARIKVKEESPTTESTVEQCRICLKDGIIPIFDHDSSENIAELIKVFADVEVMESDFFPKQLCQDCYNLLQAAILFRKHARHTDKLLRSSVEPISNTVTMTVSSYDDDDASDWNVEYESKEAEETKTYNCKKCVIKFNDINEYKTHVQSKEHKTARQQCESCDALVPSRYMVAHVARFHSLVMPFVCDFCGKGFSIRASLQRHLQTHNEILPYKCTECPYRGRFREYLKLHMRSHTGEKPYACEHCPSHFVNASNLKKHLRIHKEREYKCDQCGRAFYTEKHLETHIRADHNGIKEHQCSTCGKAFAYRKQMMKHSSKVHHRPKYPNGRIPLYIQFDKRNQQNELEDAEQNVSAYNENAL